MLRQRQAGIRERISGPEILEPFALLARLALQALRQPEQHSQREPRGGMRPLVQRQHVNAGLNLGMQRGVVRAQQRHQEEQAMCAVQKQLALAGLLALLLEHRTIEGDRLGVVPGQEAQRRGRGLAQVPVGLVQLRQQTASLVEPQGQQVVLQQCPPYRAKAGTVPLPTIPRDQVRQAGDCQTTGQKRCDPALEQGLLNCRCATIEPIGGQRHLVKQPAEQGGQALRGKGAVVLVAVGNETGFVIGIDGQPGEPEYGLRVGHRLAQLIHARKLRWKSPAYRRDQALALRRRDGVNRNRMQQHQRAGKVHVQQVLAAQEFQHRIDRRDGPGPALRRAQAAAGDTVEEHGLIGRQEHQAFQPKDGLRPRREAGVAVPQSLGVRAGANRACHRQLQCRIDPVRESLRLLSFAWWPAIAAAARPGARSTLPGSGLAFSRPPRVQERGMRTSPD